MTESESRNEHRAELYLGISDFQCPVCGEGLLPGALKCTRCKRSLPPSILSFSVEKQDGQTKISWKVVRADKVFVSGGLGYVRPSGLCVVPLSDTAYTLTAFGPGGIMNVSERLQLDDQAEEDRGQNPASDQASPIPKRAVPFKSYKSSFGSEGSCEGDATTSHKHERQNSGAGPEPTPPKAARVEGSWSSSTSRSLFKDKEDPGRTGKHADWNELEDESTLGEPQSQKQNNVRRTIMLVINALFLLCVAVVMYSDGSFSKAWRSAKLSLTNASSVDAKEISGAQRTDPKPSNTPEAPRAEGVRTDAVPQESTVSPVGRDPQSPTSQTKRDKDNPEHPIGLSLWYNFRRIHQGEKLSIVTGRRLVAEVSSRGASEEQIELELVRELVPIMPRKRVPGGAQKLIRMEMDIAQTGLYAVRLLKNGISVRTVTFEIAVQIEH